MQRSLKFCCDLPRRAVDICIAWAVQGTSVTGLLHPLQHCRSLNRTASKTMRRSLPLLALAALSTAFVLPPRQHHLAVRIRADEIEAAEDAADAEPRTAPEVNSGAERCMNQTVATRPRHRRDACSMAWRYRFLTTRRSQHGRVIAEQ